MGIEHSVSINGVRKFLYLIIAGVAVVRSVELRVEHLEEREACISRNYAWK
jgi:hypothetical protein